MKKFIVVLLAISLMALAVPAMASSSHHSDPGCNIDFKVDATKCVKVDKDVYIDKYFAFFVCAKIDPKALAECDVFKCDLNNYNIVDSFAGKFKDDIYCSFNEFTGIGQANQAAGYLNNQANVVAAAVVDTGDAAAMTEAAVEQTNYYNTLYSCFDRSVDEIKGSFNEFTGIGQVNQSAGSMNNQNNVVAISAGLGDKIGDSRYGSSGVVAANDTYLVQNNTLGLAAVNLACNSNTIGRSFNEFTGIGQANQSAGSMNNQANIVSISYTGAASSSHGR